MCYMLLYIMCGQGTYIPHFPFCVTIDTGEGVGTAFNLSDIKCFELCYNFTTFNDYHDRVR